jgi:hypothetical protein
MRGPLQKGEEPTDPYPVFRLCQSGLINGTAYKIRQGLSVTSKTFRQILSHLIDECSRRQLMEPHTFRDRKQDKRNGSDKEYR